MIRPLVMTRTAKRAISIKGFVLRRKCAPSTRSTPAANIRNHRFRLTPSNKLAMKKNSRLAPK